MGCENREPCPEVLQKARHLVLVQTAAMDGPVATFETFERHDVGSAWKRLTEPAPAVVGTKGLAWGWTFQRVAKGGEPLKVEGDMRTPAGIFALGPTFGFEPAANKGHLMLRKDEHVCVDDASSPHYSRIVARSKAGLGTPGEEMWSIPVYKSGIVVNYPTNSDARAGSCIFVHIWQGEREGTSGCIAAPEPQIAALQDFSASGSAVIAILPSPAKDRFAGCLPQ